MKVPILLQPYLFWSNSSGNTSDSGFESGSWHIKSNRAEEDFTWDDTREKGI